MPPRSIREKISTFYIGHRHPRIIVNSGKRVDKGCIREKWGRGLDRIGGRTPMHLIPFQQPSSINSETLIDPQTNHRYNF